MFSVTDATIFLSMTTAAWLLLPKLVLSIQNAVQSLSERFGGPPAAYLGLVESVRGKRRVPMSALLTSLGKFVVRSKAEKEPGKAEQMIYTGSRVNLQEFAGLKVLTALISAFAGLIVLSELGAVNPFVLLIPSAIGFYAPELWLRSRITTRQKAIVRLLPEVIDLLSLCIGAGLDFLMALHKVVNLKRFKKEPLIEELSVAMQEIKFGKRRSEALKAMAKRLNLSELSSFVRTVVQADRMGTPIAEVLAVRSVDVRAERLVKAERMALKAPIKILFPLIFFIMPCVGIIVGAPVFIEFMHQGNMFR